MASIAFKPWERVITDIRLVPKLVILMVLSTILIISKQLWDANTFYHSLTSIQLEQTESSANVGANVLNSLLSNGADESAIEEAFSAIAKNNTNERFMYLVELSNGKLIGHPTFTTLDSVSATTQTGVSFKEMISQLSGNASYNLNNDGQFEYAIQLQQADWIVIASQSSSVSEKHYDAYITKVIWQTIGMIIIFVVILLGAANIMLRQIHYLTDSIKRLRERDLATPIILECKDEYGDIARALNQTRIQLQDVIKAQVDSSKELFTMAEIMTLSMSETKDSSQEEFNEIDQLATAMNQMNSAARVVSEHAQNASSATEQAQQQAKMGQKFVLDSVNKMKELSSDITRSAQAVNQVEDRVGSISSVVGTIQSISEQTNLLALNAAIEAARAGDAGRGFAVVADEVRNLAQSTQKATVEIQDMISQLQSSANSAVEMMEKSVLEATDGADLVVSAGDELNGIVEQVNNINHMNYQIATAAEQQTTAVGEMNKNLSNVRELVEASVVVVGELVEASEEMQANAQGLDGKLQLFTV